MKPASEFKIRPFQVATLLLALVGIYFLLPQFGELKQTVAVLAHASWGWVLLGLAASALTFWFTAYTQWVVGQPLGSLRDLWRLSFAGSFASHFLPFSIGTITMATEYYFKLGKKRPQAIMLATIPTLVATSMSIIILIAVSPLTFIELNRHLRPNFHSTLVNSLTIAGIILAVIGAIVYWHKIHEFMKEAIKGFRSLRDVRQLLRTGVGSLLLILSFSAALYCSVRAIQADISFPTVITLYIASTIVGEITPTPGGLGAIEAVLVLGSSAAGLSLNDAFVATLIYRLLTFWLPLIPGGVAMYLVNRQQLDS